MYLKSIEMYGFKSFANKIVFDFHNGITGIVGPNGSGKSNVSDAVRWVLGEQSAKQLRGASMQDVIFAGTENRKPLSYAYVAITMDNSDHLLPIDYEEVTIARRVYRSGESEYLLNGSPCRLKDVNELFYDTGIGKEGYSIIGQGQIERILSGKPEERRELFDEAVGIVKFKKRKAATVKKLEHERENLVRVNDILSELERQIGPLERQSENAKLYLKKKEELKTLEVNAFLLEVEDMNARLTEIGKNYRIAETQMTESTDKQEAIKKQYAQLEEQLTQMDERIQQIRQEQSNTTLMKGKLENQIHLLEEQIRYAENADESLAERKKVLEDEKQEYLGQQQSYEAEKARLEEVLAVAQKAIDNTRSMGVGLSPCILPEVGHPNLTIEPGTMEIGIGHHGEPGIEVAPLESAEQIARRMCDVILPDLPFKSGDEVVVLVSGLGSTPLMEQYILYGEVEKILESKGIKVHKSLVGNYFTSLEMAGATLSVMRLDDELKECFDYEADAVSFKQF